MDKILYTLSTTLQTKQNLIFNMLLFRNLDNFKKNIKIWFMRQAGRYLNEYNQTKKLVNSFLSLCYNPELASEVTLQPIRRFNFDAAIIFSDILVICDALNFDVEFLNSYGPVIKNNFKNFYDLNLENLDYKKLNLVYDAIKLTRENLDISKSLIGFCGSPWTLAAYIIEGGSSKDFSKVKKFAYDNKIEFNYLIKILTESIKIHLEGQILAGCDVLQLFDSHAGVLDENDFNDFVLEPSLEIFCYIKNKYPDVGLIWFPRNSASNFIVKKDHEIFNFIDCLSVDYSTSLDLILKNIDERIFIQGNLDPCVLLSENKNEIEKKVLFIMEKMRNRKHIFNLGHGVIKTTPVENVQYVIDIIRAFK